MDCIIGDAIKTDFSPDNMNGVEGLSLVMKASHFYPEGMKEGSF
jgi:hypothetical protein